MVSFESVLSLVHTGWDSFLAQTIAEMSDFKTLKHVYSGMDPKTSLSPVKKHFLKELRDYINFLERAVSIKCTNAPPAPCVKCTCLHLYSRVTTDPNPRTLHRFLSPGPNSRARVIKLRPIFSWD